MTLRQRQPVLLFHPDEPDPRLCSAHLSSTPSWDVRSKPQAAARRCASGFIGPHHDSLILSAAAWTGPTAWTGPSFCDVLGGTTWWDTAVQSAVCGHWGNKQVEGAVDISFNPLLILEA